MPREDVVVRLREAFAVGMPRAEVQAKLDAMGQEWYEADGATIPGEPVIVAPLDGRGRAKREFKAADHRPKLTFLFDRDGRLSGLGYDAWVEYPTRLDSVNVLP